MEKHPDMRFSQILLNYRFVKQERPAGPVNRVSWQEEFYEEPQKILDRVVQALVDYEEIKDFKG